MSYVEGGLKIFCLVDIIQKYFNFFMPQYQKIFLKNFKIYPNTPEIDPIHPILQ